MGLEEVLFDLIEARGIVELLVVVPVLEGIEVGLGEAGSFAAPLLKERGELVALLQPAIQLMEEAYL